MPDRLIPLPSTDQDLVEIEFLTGKEWRILDKDLQEKYLDSAVRYWRDRGFPYITLSDQEIKIRFSWLARTDANRVFLSNSELQANNLGLDLANTFHPQMWSVKFKRHRTPSECFHDDHLLRACLRQAFLLWPHRRAAEPRTLRDILRTFRHTRRVSNFRPTIAKALYERYSNPGDRVLDFSAGYGGRLVACLTLERHYVGFDPCQMQILGLQRTYQTICRLGLTKSTAELRMVCAEDEMAAEKECSYHLILTSPPFFNREQYSDEPTQSYLRYPTYGEWRENFLYTILEESKRLLKPGGFLILNVADIENAPIATDALKFAGESLELRETFLLRQSTLPFQRAIGQRQYRYEPIFVFQNAR